ncbi:hypothetical protein FNV43_RR18692 [Rhamnella rubrinervis]|uniref:Secreted protein n=1 Tax=Rhamnella rubrinervis TaxID=2594499 RepID=A0A8K0E473_9ROSA|nr:hypothetical protein FNV43_RR18692 [Rhamnella rubrinervis]
MPRSGLLAPLGSLSCIVYACALPLRTQVHHADSPLHPRCLATMPRSELLLTGSLAVRVSMRCRLTGPPPLDSSSAILGDPCPARPGSPSHAYARCRRFRRVHRRLDSSPLSGRPTPARSYLLPPGSPPHVDAAARRVHYRP